MLVLIFSVLAGLLLVHFSEGKSSGAIVAMTATVFSTLIASLVDAARLAVGAAVGIPLFVLSNPLFVTRLLGLCALAVCVHEFHTEVLNVMDLFFRRVLSPSVHFLFSASFLVRVVYEPLAVLFNIWVAVSRTVTLGSLTLITRCNVTLLVEIMKAVLEIFMELARAFFAWLGGDGGTLLSNDFDVTSVFLGGQTLIATTVEVFDCACSEVGNLYRVPVAMVTPEAGARALNHMVNAPIAFAQEMLNMVRLESYPTLKKTAYHLSSAIQETGLWLDAALLGGASTLLKDVLRQEAIEVGDRPAKFVGSFLASLAQAGLQTAYLAVRGMVHFVVPLRLLDDAEYVLSVFSPREISATWLRESVNAGTLTMYWTLEYGFSRVSGTPAPSPRLECAFTPEFYGDRFFRSLFCAMRHAGRAATTLLAVASTAPVEFTVMTLVAGGERNGWQVLQRYDGPLRFTDPHASSCALRESTAAPEGWDLSTEKSLCHCYDEDAPFLVPAFDETKWSSLTGDRSVHCGQPQLQDFFRDVRDASEHASHIATPFMGPAVRVYARGWISFWSTTTRVALSLSDMLKGDFFDVPISGTGAYGAREDLALRKWQDGGNPTQSAGCADGFVQHDGACRELGEVARMHVAWSRRYSAAGLCRKSNSDTGCACNAALPMEEARCGCAIVFADNEATAADSYAETRWRSFAQHGWCGTQIMEPFFASLEEEASDAIKSLVDGLHPGKVDWCPQAEYLLDETSISGYDEDEFDEGFLPNRADWDTESMIAEARERLERRRAASAGANPSWTAQEEQSLLAEEVLALIDDELGHRAAYKASAACADAAELYSCAAAKAHERSVKLSKYRDTMCPLYAHEDFVCSVNDALAKTVEVWVGGSRQIWNSAMAAVTGHPKATNFDVGNRLCDAQRFFASQASVLGSFLPVKKKAKKAITKFLFYSLEWQAEVGAIFNAALQLLDRLIKGKLFKDQRKNHAAGDRVTTDGPMKDFAEKVVATGFDWWAKLFESLSELVEAYAKGGGKFFDSLAITTRLLGVGMTDLMIDFVMIYVNLFAQAMRVFSGDATQIGPLVVSILKVVKNARTLLPRISMKLAVVILEGMGDFGKAVAKIVGTVCKIIESTFVGIAWAINGLTFGAAGMDTEPDFGCTEGVFGAAVNETLGVGESRKSMNDLPAIIDELGFFGTSFCDGVVRGYKDFKWHALRPVEQEHLLSCLQQRHMGVKLAEATGILSLQTVVYDWGDRARALYSLGRASFAYFESLPPARAREYLTDTEYREYLPAVRRFSAAAAETITPELGVNILKTAFASVADAVASAGPEGARVARVAEKVSSTTSAVLKHWDRHNMTESGARMFEGLSKASAMRVVSEKTQRRSLFAHPVLSKAGRKLRVVVDASKKAARRANTYVLGAAGVSSDQNPCDSEFSIVCLNCKVLDNVVETAVEETVRGALFFRYVYAEVTLPMFGAHVKNRALALRDGVASGVKDVFSDVTVPRPENIAEEFDRMTAYAGAAAAYAAVAAAKNAGNALGVLETAAASAAKSAHGKVSATSAALDGLKDRARAYALGADGVPLSIAETLARDRTAPTEEATRTFEERQQIDWEYLWEFFPYVPANTTEKFVSGESESEVEQISIVRATAVFLSTTSDDYCPLYGHGLFYSLSRPLLAECDMDAQIYSRDSTQSERMDRYDDAMWVTLIIAVGAFALQFYVGLPFLALAAPFAVTLVWYMWMYIAYGFSYSCSGSIPVMLWADVNSYINRWHPEALCLRFSGLAIACDPQTDLAFDNTTQWRDCFEDEAVSELGYLYSSAYYLREVLPEQYAFLRTTQPFRYWLSGFRVLDLLEENLPLRENCARLLVLDIAGVVALGGTVVALAFSLVVPPVVSIVRASVQLSVQLSGLANLLVLSVTRAEAP